MTTTIMGIKELQLNLKRVADAAQRGESFTIVRDSKPVFTITPIRQRSGTLEDAFNAVRFSGDPDLSQKIDEIVYGGKLH